jgi:hypothetical protein
MSERYRQAKRALCGIYQEIFEYAYDHYSLPLEWNGGEVFITSNPSRGASLKPGRLTIITPGAPEIAWLLTRLGDAFGSLRSDAFKTEFCDRLVRLIRSHEMTAARPYRVNSILKSVIDEAFAMLEEMEEKELRPTPAMLERHPALAASGDRSAVATKQLFPM